MARQAQEAPPRSVVVVGAGVVGACTAYFLSKKGLSVTIVEQSSVASAASGKAGGFLASDWSDSSPLGPLSRASFRLHQELAEELDGMETYGYRPLQTLTLNVQEPGPADEEAVKHLPHAATASSVYICGMPEEENVVDVPDKPEDVVPRGESIEMLRRVAGHLSTHLMDDDAQVVAEQACFLPCSEDGLPLIGKVPGFEGLYVVTGHSCWGILNGPATGASLAELIVHGHSQLVDLSPYDPARFVSSRSRRRGWT